MSKKIKCPLCGTELDFDNMDPSLDSCPGCGSSFDGIFEFLEETEGDDFFDEADENGFHIEDGHLIRYYGDASEVTIPDGIIVIGDGAFCFNEELQKVIIPEGVMEIEVDAFNGCSNLKEVVIPNSLKSVGSCAFCDCLSLLEIEIPKETSIDKDAFFGCINLKNIKRR